VSIGYDVPMKKTKAPDTRPGKTGSQDTSRKGGKAGKAPKSGDSDPWTTTSSSRPCSSQLNDVARWLQHTGRRLLVVIEGRDTAGKGGVITAISETLNPRQCRVPWRCPSPASAKRTQWYFQRYVAHLPAGRRNRAVRPQLVQPRRRRAGDGLLHRNPGQRFLNQAPVFEKMLVDDGMLLFKYWLTVDQARQEKRFAERLEDPLKRWKLSPIDLKAREKYAEYGRARDAMLKATHTRHAPWTLVDFNDQRRGRLTLIRHSARPDPRAQGAGIP
jgi:polyphosphate kinase 2 (PPK2 family)